MLNALHNQYKTVPENIHDVLREEETPGGKGRNSLGVREIRKKINGSEFRSSE